MNKQQLFLALKGFRKAITKGTIDGTPLSAASSASISIPALIDGQQVPRFGGSRTLVVSSADNSETATINIPIVTPAWLSSVEILPGFKNGETDSIVSGFNPPMAAGRFIIFDPSKGTVFSDAGYEGTYTGTQQMWDYDPATKIALSFYLITGPSGEVIGVVRTLAGKSVKGNFLKGNYLKGDCL